MADESFEERVRRQLADMPMKPDPAVWHEVAAALQKERKSRWLIWYFLLLSGIAGGVFLAYFELSHPEKAPKATISQIFQSKEKIEKRDIVTKQTEAGKMMGLQQTATTELIPANKKAEKHSHPNKRYLKNTDLKFVPSEASNTNDLPEKNKRTVLPDKQSSISIQLSDSLTATAIEQSENGYQTDISDLVDTIQTAVGPPASESVQFNGPLNNIVKISDDIMKNVKKRQWKWYGVIEAGSSGLRESLFSRYNSSKSSYASGSQIFSGGGGGSGTFQSNVTSPVLKDAFSVGIAFQATKPIGKKHTIGLSFGYNLYQTLVGVGKRVDSTVYFSGLGTYNSNGFYYISNDSLSYRNQYHFLGLGIELYTPVKLSKKVSLRWQLGTGVKMLFATNGLNYDAVSGRLLRNSELMRTVHTYFSTGIDMAIGKQPFLYIGPHWQYFVSNLSKKELTNQHFSLSAVKITFIIPQKKIKMQR